jgi:hypothetical protein
VPQYLAGVWDDPEGHDTTLGLGIGKVLCVYADGRIEARRGISAYGSERLAELLRRVSY